MFNFGIFVMAPGCLVANGRSSHLAGPVAVEPDRMAGQDPVIYCVCRWCRQYRTANPEVY